MRGHKDENVLQEDVLVLYGETHKAGCRSASKEKEDRLENSPFTSLVNLCYKRVELTFSIFLFEHEEPFEEQSQEKERHDYCNNEESIGKEGSNFSDSCIIFALQNLHYREEGKIKVAHHKEANVSIEFELRELILNEISN
jgi:hypothetical protein